VFALQTVGVLLIGETVTRRAGARRSLVPQLALPRSARRAVLGAAPVLFAVWALAGFYGALGPSIVHQVSGSSSIVLGGLSLFVLAGVAAVAVYVLREADPHGVMALGVLALVAGVATTLAAIDLGSTVLFFLGTAVAGVGFGSGFQGGIRTVIPLLQAHERAGVLSVLYVVSYLGMGVPAVVAGFLVVHGGGLLPTSYEYGVAVMALALLALTVVVRRPERAPASEPVHAGSGRLCTQAVQ
jgi:hypothetical protein